MSALTATVEPVSAPTYKRLLARHPFMSFFLITYVGSWLLELPMVLGQDGLGIFPFHVPILVYIVLFLLNSFSGPTLAAFLVTDALEGKAGTRKLFRRYFQWRVGLAWYLATFFGFPLVFLAIASILNGSLPLAELQQNGATFFTTYLPAVLIFPAIIQWGEEPGWRGFAQTRMQERYGPLASSLAIGVLHGLWHLPIFLLVNGPVAAGPFQLLPFLRNTLGAAALTIAFTWVFNHAQQSILIAVLIHASNNATSTWINKLFSHPPAGMGTWVYGFYILFALGLILFTRGRLGYQSEQPAKKADL